MATLFYKHKAIRNDEFRSKRMLWGSLIATLTLTFMFLTMGKSNSHDFRWIVLPYILVPISGAVSGWFFHVLEPFRTRNGVIGFASKSFGVIVFCLLFIVAFVVGMNGPD